MNKTYTLGLLAMFAIAVFSVTFVLAEENIAVSSPGPNGEIDYSTGLISDVDANNSVSDDETVSGFRYGWEKFKMGFIRNQTIKAERELQLARWKVAEAKFAMQRGNVEKAEKAMKAHDAILGKFQERIAKMENKSLTPGLEQALNVHQERLANLNLVLQSANLTDEQKLKVEERISKLEDKNQQLGELRVKVGERRQIRLENFENKTQRIENAGDRVQQRMQNRTPNMTQNRNRTQELRNLRNVNSSTV